MFSLRANTASASDFEKYATDRPEPIGQGHNLQISWVDEENGDHPEWPSPIWNQSAFFSRPLPECKQGPN
jgi:hypothetical protein